MLLSRVSVQDDSYTLTILDKTENQSLWKQRGYVKNKKGREVTCISWKFAICCNYIFN